MKPTSPQYASTVIDSLGGTAKVAILCNTTKAAISAWRKNGIPEYRMMFLRLAKPKIFKQLAQEGIEP